MTGRSDLSRNSHRLRKPLIVWRSPPVSTQSMESRYGSKIRRVTVAPRVVQLSDQPVATPHEPPLRRPARPVTILDVAGIGLGGEQLIASHYANRVPAHSQEHDPDGYVSLVDLRKPGNVDFVSGAVFTDREGW